MLKFLICNWDTVHVKAKDSRLDIAELGGEGGGEQNSNVRYSCAGTLYLVVWG